MVNKKGWLKVVEAFIAVILILSVFFVLSQKSIQNTKTVYGERIEDIAEEIASNYTLRGEIISTDENSLDSINEFIYIYFPRERFEAANVICQVDVACGLQNYPNAKEVYVAERIIGAVLEEYNPKKIKIFVWRID